MRGRVLLDGVRMHGPVHAGEGDDEAMVELLELRGLLAHDIADLATVLAREEHTHVAAVAEARDARKELVLRELGGEREQCSPHRGRQVHLLRQPHPRVVFDDAHWFVHPPCEVQCAPVKQIRAQIVDRRHPVLDGL